MKKMKIGVIGCGDISSTYLEGFKKSDLLEVTACADLRVDRARAQAAAFGAGRGCSVDELLGDPEIELVVNLTVPRAHAQVAHRILESGKHAYNEKPLATDRDAAQCLMREAQLLDLRLGCAPDVFLGGVLQTARHCIDEGLIGDPVGFTGSFLMPGASIDHPNPAFFFETGSGPLEDMGPYLFTALVHLLGPVGRVFAMGNIPEPTLFLPGGIHPSATVEVTTPSHIHALIELERGISGSISSSLNVWGSKVPLLEIYGTRGVLDVPNPCRFGGDLRILTMDSPHVAMFHDHDAVWKSVAPTHAPCEESRGLGVFDMVSAIRKGGAHRAHPDLAFHVLDTALTCLESSEEGLCKKVHSSCLRPSPIG